MTFEMTDVGAPLTDAQLDRAERELDVKLPAAYRSFLLRTNGGTPHPDFFPIEEHKTLSFGRIACFFGLALPQRDRTIDFHYKVLVGQLPPYCFPIAATQSEDIICLSLGRVDEGRVYFWEKDDARLSAGYDNAYVIASNFDKFLAAIHAIS
jgi:hypothetical protein